MSGVNKSDPVGLSAINDQDSGGGKSVKSAPKLDDLIPKIANRLQDELHRLGVRNPHLSVTNEQLMRKIFSMIYEGVLPPPYAGEVSKEQFITFCETNQVKISELALSTGTKSTK
jgi:hypothetical protein